MEMSKSDFAAHIDVSPGRVSQYLRDGIIGPDALAGEGRSARIVVEKAVAQIAARRHVGQALGNGLLTRLEQPAKEPQLDAPAISIPRTVGGSVADQIQLERLEQERRKNRLAAVDEAKALGQLVDKAAFERELGKAAQSLLNSFVGMAPDIANAIASKFELPQRDVLHLVRKVMNEKRASSAAAQQLAAETMPETVEVTLE